MNKGFTVEAIVTRISSMVDGGLSIGLHTKELSAEEKAKIMDFHNQAGWLLFKENEVEEKEIPTQQAEFGIKTPSQRLRSVLYVLWEQKGAPGDFDVFYRSRMEQFIDDIKAQLQ